MALFGGISERFWNYVSPHKPHETQTQTQTFKTPALPHMKTAVKRPTPDSETTSSRLSMSPQSRVRGWKVARDESYRPLENRAPFATPSYGRPSPTRDALADDLEGNTLLEDVSEEEDEYDAAQHDANDETMVEEEYNLKEELVIDVEEERKKWAVKAVELREDGWSKDAIVIYIKIGLRGFEPALPTHWAFDFPTLPSVMFSSDDKEVFIKSVRGYDFRAIKALQNLMFLGTNVRDARHHYTSNRTSDVIAKRGINAYFKWAKEDGFVNGSSDIPTLAVEAGDVDVSSTQLQENMVLKLHKLADRYRDALRVHPSTEDEDDDMSANPPSEAEYTHELPTLYGIIASHTVLAFVSYDVAAFQPGLRMIGLFDFGEIHTDVWNSLAVSQFVIHARNAMMKLQQYTKADHIDAPMENDDPDA